MAMWLPASSSAASWSSWPGAISRPEILFDAVCETRNCLPDAVQLLTPCTIGNGWLKVINVGRFALSLYDKYEGKGVRVFLDPVKVADWPEINTWYLKLKPKKEQDPALLLEEIRQAGPEILGWQHVQIRPQLLGKRHRGRIVICPLCREAYPAQDGGICRACQGEPLYLTDGHEEESRASGPVAAIVAGGAGGGPPGLARYDHDRAGDQ